MELLKEIWRDFLSCCDRKRGNDFTLKKGRFKLNIRKKYFMMRVVKDWNRLSKELVDVPSLETFKVRVNGALSNLIYLKMSLCTAGGLAFKGPFLSSSMIL